MTLTPKKLSSITKSPIKELTKNQFLTIAKNIPPKKVINDFLEDIIKVNTKNKSNDLLDKKSFCKYLKTHVSKKN